MKCPVCGGMGWIVFLSFTGIPTSMTCPECLALSTILPASADDPLVQNSTSA